MRFRGSINSYISLHRQDGPNWSVNISDYRNSQITRASLSLVPIRITVYCCLCSNGSRLMFNFVVGASEVGVLMCWSRARDFFSSFFPFLIRENAHFPHGRRFRTPSWGVSWRLTAHTSHPWLHRRPILGFCEIRGNLDCLCARCERRNSEITILTMVILRRFHS